MVFKIYDIDKNGQVQSNEIEKVIVAMYEFLGDKINCSVAPQEIVSIVMNKLGISFKFKEIFLYKFFDYFKKRY